MYSTITFPGLGIELNPSRIAFSIGTKPIYWYGIIIAAGFLLAVFYALKRCKQFGLTQDNIIDMLICAVPAAIVCARLYYVIFSWDIYRDNPISILYIWEGGIAIYGGVIGAVLGLTAYTLYKKVSTGALLDIGGLGLLIGQSIGRWGNFINREAFGSQTECFFRMGLQEPSGSMIYVHPTFLYESLWNALGLLILHFFSKKRKFDGQVFIMYLGWYGLGRMLIEGLRTDSLYVAGTNLRVSQLLAGICFLASVVYLVYCAIFKEYQPENLYVNRVAAGNEKPAHSEETEETGERSQETESSGEQTPPERTHTVSGDAEEENSANT